MDDDLVRCKICQELYDNETHTPRRMPCCEHTYCESCLQKAIDMKNKYQQADFKLGKFIVCFLNMFELCRAVEYSGPDQTIHLR